MYRRLKHFFKRPTETDLPYRTDIHSHLIPGIDDGADTMEASLEMIRSFETAGFKKLITTPHIMPGRFDNDTGSITKGLEALRRAVAQAQLNVHIDAAAEYFFDEHLPERIAQKDVLTFDDNALLFEFSYLNPPFNPEPFFFEMQSVGFVPVLAHPERYRYFHSSPEVYARFKTLGVRFQVNINAFEGHYGSEVKKTAQYLAQEGYIDYLGSDAHRLKQIEPLHTEKTRLLIRKIAQGNPLRNGLL